jgi:hypothetical protein
MGEVELPNYHVYMYVHVHVHVPSTWYIHRTMNPVKMCSTKSWLSNMSVVVKGTIKYVMRKLEIDQIRGHQEPNPCI